MKPKPKPRPEDPVREELEKFHQRLETCRTVQSRLSLLPQGKLRDHLSELMRRALSGQWIPETVFIQERSHLEDQVLQLTTRVRDLELALETKTQECDDIRSAYEVQPLGVSSPSRFSIRKALFWVGPVAFMVIVTTMKMCGSQPKI